MTLSSLTTDPVALGFQIQLEFRNVVVLGEGKTGVPGEKPLGARTRTNNKLNPHLSPGIEPGPHWWEANTCAIPAPHEHTSGKVVSVEFPRCFPQGKQYYPQISGACRFGF